MIKKSLIEAIELAEHQEIERIGRLRNAKNRGEVIQMPPLHIAPVDVHREYEKENMEAKEMPEIYKRATTTADRLQEQI